MQRDWNDLTTEQQLTEIMRDALVAGDFEPGEKVAQDDVIKKAVTFANKHGLTIQGKSGKIFVGRGSARAAIIILTYEGLLERKTADRTVVTTVSMHQVRQMISLRWTLTKLIALRLCVDGARFEWVPSRLKDHLAELDAIAKRVAGLVPGTAEFTARLPELREEAFRAAKASSMIYMKITEMAGFDLLLPVLRTALVFPSLYHRSITDSWVVRDDRISQVHEEWTAICAAITECRAHPRNASILLAVEKAIDRHFTNLVRVFFGDPANGDEYIDINTLGVLRFQVPEGWQGAAGGDAGVPTD